MTLTDFTRTNLCLPKVRGRDPAAVLSELSRALEREHVVPASLSLFNVALNHYFFANGDTIGAAAYSLGRLRSLSATTFAVAQARQEFWWRNGCAPVQLVFLIASPADDPAAESAVIAGVKRLAEDRATLRRLHSASAAAAMFAALARIPLWDGETMGAVAPASVPTARNSAVQTASQSP